MAREEAPSFELVIEVESDLYAPDHPGWRSQVEGLVELLEREVGPLTQGAAPAPGQKGAVAEVVLHGLSTGVAEAAAVVMFGWVRRHAGRRIRVRRKGDHGEAVTIDASDSEEAALPNVTEQVKELAKASSDG